MKNSPYFSHASPATTSLDSNISNNTKRDTARCVAGVLRRLLCSGSLPTYPSDGLQLKIGADSTDKVDSAPAATRNPGIVARLMGLDPLPILSDPKAAIEKTPNSISRSRSMNCSDDSHDPAILQGRHRRAKSSLSFMESSSAACAATHFELENDEFFVLSFDCRRDEGKRVKRRVRESKQRKTEKCKDENCGTEETVVVPKPTCEKGALDGNLIRNAAKDHTRIARKRGKFEGFNGKFRPLRWDSSEKRENCVEASEAESGSENLSPVSILDCAEFLADPESQTPVGKPEEDCRLEECGSSRRKLSTSLEKCDAGSRAFVGGGCETEAAGAEILQRKKSEKQREDDSDTWSEICRLAAGDATKSICGKCNWGIEDLEEIDCDLGLKILDELVEELVDHLVII